MISPALTQSEKAGQGGRNRTSLPAGARNRWVVITVILAVTGAQHASNLTTGRADNGDFTRSMVMFVAKPAGFSENWPAPEREPDLWRRRFFNYSLNKWELKAFSLRDPSVLSSAQLLWAPAWVVAKVFRQTTIDSRWIGASSRLILMLILGIAGWLLSGRIGVMRSLALLLPLGALTSDGCVTSYLNSFYQESASLVFFCLALSSYAWLFSERRAQYAATVFASAALLAVAKPQHGPSAIVVAVLAVAALTREGWLASPRRLWLVVGALAAVVTIAVVTIRATPRDMKRANAYAGLFNGLLRFSDRPRHHLATLEIPPWAEKSIGTNAYSAGASALVNDRKVPLRTTGVLRVALAEPAAFLRLVAEGSRQLQDFRVEYLGCSPEYNAELGCGVSPWCSLQGRYFPRGPISLVFLGLVLAVGMTVGIWSKMPYARWGFLLATCASVSSIECIVSLLGDGLSDVPKHFYLANTAFGLLAVMAPAAVVARCWPAARCAEVIE